MTLESISPYGDTLQEAWLREVLFLKVFSRVFNVTCNIVLYVKLESA